MKSTKQLLALSLLLIALMVGGGVLFRRARIQNSGPALYAASFHETAKALSLIDNGAPVNYIDPEFGGTALHQAASGGQDAIVAALLAHGTKIDATNKYGSTPLSYAAKSGQVSTVRLLLSKGANPQARNTFGRTPLEDARGFLKLQHPSPREKAVYPQIVAILSAVTRDAK